MEGHLFALDGIKRCPENLGDYSTPLVPVKVSRALLVAYTKGASSKREQRGELGLEGLLAWSRGLCYKM